MGIPNFNGDVKVISKLSDLPNANEGLTAEELKARFDEAAVMLKQYINDTLVPAIRAANVPFQSSTTIAADNVQAAILAVQEQIRDAATGTLVNGSVTTEKLAEKLLERVFGGLAWVGMDEPKAADNAAAGFPVGQMWLRPQFSVVNYAGGSWTGNGCSVNGGVVTGNQTSSVATCSQSLAMGNAGDKVLVLFDVRDRSGEVSEITVSFNGGEELDAAGGVFETELSSTGTLEVRFTTRWNSASLASTGWTMEHFTVVNKSKTVRDAGSAKAVRDWTAFVNGLRPFVEKTFPAAVWIEVADGRWWPLMTGSDVEGGYLKTVGGVPQWVTADTVRQDLNLPSYLKARTGYYAGTGGLRSVDLGVTPVLLVVGTGEPKEVNSGDQFFDNPEVLFQGAKVRRYANAASGGITDYWVSLSGSTFTASGTLLNRAGVTYTWVAIYE